MLLKSKTEIAYLHITANNRAAPFPRLVSHHPPQKTSGLWPYS